MGYVIASRSEFAMGDHCVIVKCASAQGALMLTIVFDHQPPVITLYIDTRRSPFSTDVEISGYVPIGGW